MRAQGGISPRQKPRKREISRRYATRNDEPEEFFNKLLEQLEGCIRRYRYTGSFFTYLFRTLEYAGRGICPIVTSSLDGPIASNECKRKIENVVYDPETNEIGFYDPKKLFSFDSESQFGV